MALARRPRLVHYRSRRPALGSGRLGDRANLQVNAGLLLQCPDDTEQIFGCGVAVRTKHPHQALRRSVQRLAQPLEADGRVDIGPQRRAALVEFALQQGLHGLLKQGLAESRLALRPRPHGVTKIPGHWHRTVSPGCVSPLTYPVGTPQPVLHLEAGESLKFL